MPLAIELAAARVAPCRSRDPRRPARPVPAADGRSRTGARTDTAGLGRLVACPADGARARPVPPPGCVHGRLRPRRCAGSRRRRRLERFQVLDLLALLVDKSLVVAEDRPRRMRYRLLETVRQYALEKLGESGRPPMSQPCTAIITRVAVTDARAGSRLSSTRRKPRSTTCGPPLRGVSKGATSTRLGLAAHCTAVARQGQASEKDWHGWKTVFDARETSGQEVAPSILARALADKAMLDAWLGLAPTNRSGRASPGDRTRPRRPRPAGPCAHRPRPGRGLRR